MNPIKKNLGILGLGEGISILHASNRSEKWTTKWICDLSEDLCKQRSAQYPVGKYTLKYDEMLADPELSTVAIYTPDPMHADHCIQALNAGKNVICTKPLIDDLSKGKELLDALDASEGKLMVGMSCRFFHTFMQQRSVFEEDRLGKLLSVEAHYHGDKRQGTSGKWGKAKANNWIYTGLVHPTDLIYWYMGMPEEVYGYGQVSPAMTERGYDIPDNYHFVLKSADGTPITVSGMYGAPGNHSEAEGSISCTIRGSNATCEARFPNFDFYTNFYEEGSLKHSSEHLHPYYYPWGGSSHHAGEFQNYLEYFSDCLDENKNPRPSAEDGIKVVATLLSMEKAMKTGKPVKVNETLEAHNLTSIIG